MDVLAHHDFPGDGIRRNDSMEFDARRRTSASPLSSKIARDACSNYCKPPLWRLLYERSICVWTWNRAREIRLATRTRQGFFSGLDSIIIHRLHRRRVLIIRLERARRMDREEWLSGRKSTAGKKRERERERESWGSREDRSRLCTEFSRYGRSRSDSSQMHFLALIRFAGFFHLPLSLSLLSSFDRAAFNFNTRKIGFFIYCR